MVSLLDCTHVYLWAAKRGDCFLAEVRCNVHRWFIDMNNIVPKSIIALFFALSAYSCTGDSMVGPPSDSDQIIPFMVGNRWTYADSLLTSSGSVTASYVVTVTDTIDTLGRKWWRIENTFNPSIASNTFAVSGDSIFSLQATESINGMAPIVSLEYVVPTDNQTSRYHATFDGDALVTKTAARMTHGYSVAAGTFDNCIVYTYDIYPEHYREIVSPGIGTIALTIQADSIPHVSPAWQRRITLTDYRIRK